MPHREPASDQTVPSKPSGFEYLIEMAAPIIPTLLLLSVAAAQLNLVRSHHLTPWKGGSFGMFASSDHWTKRKLHIEIHLRNGGRFYLDPSPLMSSESGKRLLSLPTEMRIRSLAEQISQLSLSVDPERPDWLKSDASGSRRSVSLIEIQIFFPELNWKDEKVYWQPATPLYIFPMEIP